LVDVVSISMTTKVKVTCLHGEILCEVLIDNNTRVYEVMKQIRVALGSSKICEVVLGTRQLPPKSRLAEFDIEGEGLLTAVVVGKLAKLMADGQNAMDLYLIDYDLDELNAAGFGATQLKEQGLDARFLKENGCDPAQLKAIGFPLWQLKHAGFPTAQLKVAGFGLQEFKFAGYSAYQLKDVGFDAAQLKAARFNTRNLRDAGFSAQDLKDAGLRVSQLQASGFHVGELKAAGFDEQELKDAPRCRIRSFADELADLSISRKDFAVSSAHAGGNASDVF